MRKITQPLDVAALPWRGNYRDDCHLFDLVSAYVRNEPDPYKAYEAERLCSKYGMGADLPKRPRKADLEYMREIYADRWYLSRSKI